MRTLLVALFFTVGCGGRLSADMADAETTDSGSTIDAIVVRDSMPPSSDVGARDTAVVDTRPPEPWTCAAPLAPDFACVDATPKPGMTACTDAAIKELVDGCFGDFATSAKCSAAQTKHAGCSKCALSVWTYGDRAFFDVGACIKAIDPMSACSKAARCQADCLEAVCGECDPTPGTGKSGSSASSELDECQRDEQRVGSTTKPPGACYHVASKDYAACVTQPKFAPCFVRSVADVTVFIRGACRDGGNWSRAYEELP